MAVPEDKAVSALHAGHGHFVHFYDDPVQLADDIVDFISEAAQAGGSGIVIARPGHRAELAKRAAGWDPGQLIMLDAQRTLEQFMVEGWPDAQRFEAVVGSALEQACAGGGPVHAFGEMVALLCEAGRHEAAVALEGLWNEMAERLQFSLFCGYPWHAFPTTGHAAAFEQVCAAHQHVCTSGDGCGLPAHTGGMAAMLEQRNRALEAELARLRNGEQALLDHAHEEREQLLADVRAASTAKDEFLAMLGHELRNPLSPIVTALQLMRMRGGERDVRERDIIQRQVDHLVRLVDDLLDVSRVTRHKIDLKIECVQVEQLAGRAVEIARPLLDQCRHQLVVDVAPGLCVQGDPVRLAQVISNLLTNAARFTPAGGKVALRARLDPDGGLAISVKDNGVGLAPGMLARVFDLFVQGPRGLDRAEGGLGIGLALVKHIVELHGGAVQARSDGVGKGSEFVVRLPAQACGRADSGAIAPRRVLPAPPVRQRFLVVDDNVDAANTLGELLEALGQEARVFNEPMGALDEAVAFDPDVALLDIGLPVMDGYELAARLREKLGHCRMVALTGYGQDSDRERSAAAGFEQHLVKPIGIDQLMALSAAPQS